MTEGYAAQRTAVRRLGHRELAATVIATALAVAVFVWAKWDPYWHKIPSLARTHDMGRSVVTGAAAAPPAVSFRAGWDFASRYLGSVWPAVVAGLVVGAATEVLVPRRWLLRVLGSPHGTVRAALAGLPMMLCTCCSAPVTVGLRRSHVPARPALAYWLATPLLNPAVIAFTALALPWRWAGLRLAMGLGVVAVAVAAATRRGDLVPEPSGGVDQATAAAPSASGFVRALAGLAARLLPEYLALVFALGALRGVLFPLGHDLAAWGVLGAVVLAVSGVLLAVPTGAEVAVVAALLAAGAPGWLAAALLVTLPAVSLPSLAMVGQAFPRRVLAVVPVVVAVAGVVTSGLALAIGL